MIKNYQLSRRPYRTPDTAVPDFLLEQSIATGSTNETLTDMGVGDIYDDEFNPIG